MWLLFLEAGLALGLLVFIVWWTMFSGRSEAMHEEANEATKNDDERA